MSTTEDAIVYDDRARAFVQARDLLESARATREAWAQAVEDDRAAPDELPAEYWAAIAEANVLAQLARCDAGVGMMAGAYAVQAKTVDRRSRRIEARDRARAQLEANRRVRGGAAVAPWREGMEVRLTEGDYAGRRGLIYSLDLDNQPPIVTVELAPPGRPDDPSEPIVLTVLPSQIELVVE
ncbi:hypothetical protein KDW75_gp51 [Mycobacterium phage Mercurio]|uniref:Uncharacterized protein n=1 Tax=Mycobacterium phage Mercurio TaxID=2575612 RepID=A0A5J6T6P7_9CAUD|nr:hypothetical protein KDW75_gp51 [Mycobacterium phage Mercurio]QFG06053.1 hypothetical protein PBI_MERCURIO_51 [Mycobacterium phage Mercurio]